MRLQAQPAQVLGLLIAGNGEVVTREALRDAVWNDGTFVDFDRGLNFCISQIRTALGDSADSPRFIRTVPKRGYQFIAPLAPAPPPVAHISRRGLIVIGCTAGAALLAGGVWIARRPAETRIAVTRFDNETGNPALDRFTDSVTDLLVAELTSSAGHYGVIGNAAILRRPRQQRNLTEIASTLRAQFVILGQIQPNGTGVRVLAHLIRMPQQTHVAVSRTDANLGDPLANAQKIVNDFARRLPSYQPVKS